MRLRWPVIVVSLLALGVGCAAVRPVVQGAGAGAPKALVPATAVHHAAKVLDWRAAQKDIPPYPDCFRRPIAVCTVVHGTGKRVLLMGDSLARMWLPAFIAIAKRESLTLAVAIYPACPWPENLNGLAISPDCNSHREYWYRHVIPGFDPNIVFLANRPYDAPGNVLTMGIGGRTVLATDPVAIHAIAALSSRSIHMLRRAGRELVLLEPTPLPPVAAYDPMTCVSTGDLHCSFTVNPALRSLTELDRDLAVASDVWSLDLNRLVCPRFPICDSIVRGMIVRRDHTHLTATFARSLNVPLEAMLKRQHII